MDKIILFDLDGTLIDSTDAIVNTFKYSFEKKGFEFSGCDEDIIREIGYPLDIMYEHLGVPKIHAFDFVDTYKDRYKDIAVAQTDILPFAKESVDLAKENARLGVVTTKTTKYSIPILQNLEIWDQFDCIVGRQEVINPKPHPEPVLKALELMEVDKNKFDIYMIGDTKLDLIAAKEAGVKGVGVLSGYGNKEELLKYAQIVEENSLEAVKKIIEC